MGSPRSQWSAVMFRLNAGNRQNQQSVFWTCVCMFAVGLIFIALMIPQWQSASAKLQWQTQRAHEITAPFQELYSQTLRTGDSQVMLTNLRKIRDGMSAQGFIVDRGYNFDYINVIAQLDRLPALRQISEKEYQTSLLEFFKVLPNMIQPKNMSFPPKESAESFFALFWIIIGGMALTGLVAGAIYLWNLREARYQQEICAT